jgi:hypothetical protein
MGKYKSASHTFDDLRKKFPDLASCELAELRIDSAPDPIGEHVDLIRAYIFLFYSISSISRAAAHSDWLVRHASTESLEWFEIGMPFSRSEPRVVQDLKSIWDSKIQSHPECLEHAFQFFRTCNGDNGLEYAQRRFQKYPNPETISDLAFQYSVRRQYHEAFSTYSQLEQHNSYEYSTTDAYHALLAALKISADKAALKKWETILQERIADLDTKATQAEAAHLLCMAAIKLGDHERAVGHVLPIDSEYSEITTSFASFEIPETARALIEIGRADIAHIVRQRIEKQGNNKQHMKDLLMQLDQLLSAANS